jgi:hypothetical protein
MLCINVGSYHVGIVVRSEDHVVALQATTGLLLCQANDNYEDRIRTDKIGQNKVPNPPRDILAGEGTDSLTKPRRHSQASLD